MKYLILVIALILSIVSPSVLFAGNGYGHNGHNGYNNQHQVQNVIVERVIPLYDITVASNHNQYVKVQPVRIEEIIKIERQVFPQNYLLQRLEFPQQYYVEKQVVPVKQNYIIDRLQHYSNHCVQHGY